MAMIQNIPSRANLVKAKPDFAFGLKYSPKTQLYKMLRQYKDNSVPSVDAFVTSALAVPFLIFESRSSDGSLRRAENQMTNAMIKAHDILCSLRLQDDLPIFGMIQIHFAIHLYVSFSTLQIDEDGVGYTGTVCTP